MIKRLLTLDPKSRITSAAALEHPWLQDEEIIAKAEKLMSRCNFKPNAKPSSMCPPALPAVSLCQIFIITTNAFHAVVFL